MQFVEHVQQQQIVMNGPAPFVLADLVHSIVPLTAIVLQQTQFVERQHMEFPTVVEHVHLQKQDSCVTQIGQEQFAMLPLEHVFSLV